MKPSLLRIPGNEVLGPTLAVMRKEMRHIVRDVQTLFIVIALPIILMFLYGYALTLDVQNLDVLVEDPASSPESRDLINRIEASALFHVKGVVPAVTDLNDVLIRHQVKALFRFPPDLARELLGNGRPGCVQVVIDGSDPNVGTLIRNSAEPLIRGAVLKMLHIEEPTLLTLCPRVLYNPDQKSSLFFVPGLMAMILVLISTLLTSLTITREKERGTLEQLLVSPLHPVEIIIGKLAPYVVLAAVDGFIILAVGYWAFGVRIAGSLLLLANASLLYILTALSLGLLFSTVAKSQQQAMFMALPVTLMPTMLLSGFIFPISSMPWVLQWVAHAIPATYYLRIIRGIMLKGIGMGALWSEVVVLSGMIVLLIAISVKKFKVKL
ncbi:MAG: hypothetical protein A2293_10720 [Elusimicrobia bacterium RIFOXYB2_FULL_49_7]|nr:MAG: hypothetical protein A2293_10720 [Elusimicrobia bacterium RIFOXYB2_FULL_49_7]